MLPFLSQVVSVSEVLSEQKQRGKAIHAGHISVRLRLILLPYVPFPAFGEGLV